MEVRYAEKKKKKIETVQPLNDPKVADKLLKVHSKYSDSTNRDQMEEVATPLFYLEYPINLYF